MSFNDEIMLNQEEPVHDTFNLVGGKTMRCDFCNARNTSFLRECSTCQLHICYTCAYQGKLDSDPRHHLVLDADSDGNGNTRESDTAPTDPGWRVEDQTRGIPQTGSSASTGGPPSTGANRHTSAPYDNGNSPMGDRHSIPVAPLGRDYDDGGPGAIFAGNDGASGVLHYNHYQHGPVHVGAHPGGVAYGGLPNPQYGAYTQGGAPNPQYGAYAQGGAPNPQYGAYAQGGAPGQQYGAYAYGGAPGYHGMLQQDAAQGSGQPGFGQYSQISPQHVQGAAGPNHHSGFNVQMVGPAGATAVAQYGFPPQHGFPQNGNAIAAFQQAAQMPPERPYVAAHPNPNSDMRMQDSPHAFTSERTGRQRLPASEGYHGPTQTPVQPSQTTPGPGPGPGHIVGVSGSQVVGQGAPEGAGHPADVLPDAEQAAANFIAHQIRVGGLPEGGCGQQYLHLLAAWAKAWQRLGHLPDYPRIGPEFYPAPAQQPRPSYQHAPPAHHGAHLEVADFRLRPSQEGDAPASPRDESSEPPRRPEEARVSSSPAKQQVNALRKIRKSTARESAARRHKSLRAAAAANDSAAATQDERPRAVVADDQEEEDTIEDTHLFPTPERDTSAGRHPVPGSEEVKEALSSSRVLAGVRRREGSLAALDMAGAARALVRLRGAPVAAPEEQHRDVPGCAAARTRARDEELERRDEELERRDRANEAEIERRRADLMARRRRGSRRQRRE